jgi:hypothetical protein
MAVSVFDSGTMALLLLSGKSPESGLRWIISTEHCILDVLPELKSLDVNF